MQHIGILSSHKCIEQTNVHVEIGGLIEEVFLNLLFQDSNVSGSLVGTSGTIGHSKVGTYACSRVYEHACCYD